MTERHKSLEETKILLKSVLVANKKGLPFIRLEREYKSIIGKPIPYMKLGFHTLEDFLRDIPDTVLIEEDERGVKLAKVKVDSTVAHINKFVQNQKENEASSRKQKPNHGGKSRFSTTTWNYPGSKMPPFEIQTKIILLIKEKQEIKLEEFESFYQSKYKDSVTFSTYGFESLADMLSRMKETIIVRQNSQGCFTVIPRNVPNANSTNNARHGLPGEIIFAMKQMISNYPQGITAHEFLSVVKEKFSQFDFKHYGHQSMVSFSRQLPEVFLVNRDQNGEFILMPAKQDDSSDDEKPCAIVAQTANLAPLDEGLEYVFSKVGRVLSLTKNPDNTAEILMSSEREALAAIERFDGNKLDGIPFRCALKTNRGLVRMGSMGSAETKESYVNQLDGLQVSPQPTKNGTIALNKTIAVCETNAENKTNAVNKTIADIKNNTENKTIANNKTIAEIKPIPREKLPSDLEENKNFVEVIVGEVYSPYKFFVQLKAHYPELMALMDGMDMFYKGDIGVSEEYLFKKENCKLGMHCAALYYGRWHRGLLTKVNWSKKKFSVFYIDYGTLASVPLLDLRLLDIRFTEMPSQALKFRLSGVKPCFGHINWQPESVRMFLKLCSKNGFNGFVAKIEQSAESDKLFIVRMHDTFTNNLPNGIVLNEYLVNEKFADLNPFGYVPMDQACIHTWSVDVGPSGEAIYPAYPPLRVPNSGKFCEEVMIPDTVNNDSKSQILKNFILDPIGGNCSNGESLSQILNGNLKNVVQNPSECSDIVRKAVPPGKSPSIQNITLSSCDVTIHVICFEEKAYMTSTEISELFPKWNKKDLLLKMLKLKKIKSDDIFINPEEHLELYELCVIEEVRGVDVTQDLNLHPIQTVPEYCRLWPPLPDVSEELMKISKDFSKE